MILHEPPFLFVGEVRSETPFEVWAAFPAGNPYIGTRTILLETMAQSVGMFAGRQAGRARPGVLAMLKKVVFHRDAGAGVFTRVTPGRWFGKLRVFQTEAHDEAGLVASADIIVAEAA